MIQKNKIMKKKNEHVNKMIPDTSKLNVMQDFNRLTK